MNNNLYAIIPFYNYFNNTKRNIHLSQFINNYCNISNLKIVIAEGVADNTPLIDHSSLVYSHQKYNTTQKIWIKENLINLAVTAQLPSDWQFMCWIDCDVQFLYPNWVDASIRLLKNYDAIQMFDYVFHWNEKQDNFYNAHIGYINSLTNKIDVNGLKHCGMAWGMKRSLYERVGGLWENNVIGSGDTLIGKSITQQFLDKDIINGQLNYIYSPEYLEQITKYYKLFSGTKYSYLKNPILSGWHGSWDSKKYVDRHKILKKYDFNANFINKNNNGIVNINNKYTDLVGDIHEYMETRETLEIPDDIKIDFYTTFNPKNIDLQYKTWIPYAKNIYAIQDHCEILDIPNCKIIYNPSVEIEGKKLQKVKDIISIAKKQSKYFVIINSDIELSKNIPLWKQIISKINTDIVIAHRYNYNDFFCNKESNGFDMFVLNDSFDFDSDDFLIGACAWDWYMPYLAIKQNIPVNIIDQKFLYHKDHDQQWNEKIFEISQEWFHKQTGIDRKIPIKRETFNDTIITLSKHI